VLLAHLQEGRVQPDIGVGPLKLAAAEALYFGIQLLTQAADLALADAFQAQRLDQVIHAARTDTLDVGFPNRGHQRALRPLARLQQRGEEAAITYPGHLQLKAAHSCVPAPLPVAAYFGEDVWLFRLMPNTRFG